MLNANRPADNLMFGSANKHLPDKSAALTAGVMGFQVHSCRIGNLTWPLSLYIYRYH